MCLRFHENYIDTDSPLHPVVFSYVTPRAFTMNTAGSSGALETVKDMVLLNCMLASRMRTNRRGFAVFKTSRGRYAMARVHDGPSKITTPLSLTFLSLKISTLKQIRVDHF